MQELYLAKATNQLLIIFNEHRHLPGWCSQTLDGLPILVYNGEKRGKLNQLSSGKVLLDDGDFLGWVFLLQKIGVYVSGTAF